MTRTQTLDRYTNALRRRVAGNRIVKRCVTVPYALAYYSDRERTWQDTTWLGVKTAKLPSDLWVYQELLHEIRPDLIIETGTNAGGSALYLASVCDAIGTGRIVTVDIETLPNRPDHPRIEYVEGSSIEPSVVEHMTAGGGTTLVILDSDHSRDHVLAELRAYAPHVSPGSYVIVEDSNVNGHPVERRFGPGPMEALQQFLAEHRDFESDLTREKFMMTFNPRGYLRRLR